MKIQYFHDTDTLYIQFRESPVAETRDMDENTLVEFDAQGQLIALTLEHARERTDLPRFSYEHVSV